MARKPRIEYSGAFYHVITRGNRKETIFFDAEDREKFLDKLLEYKKRYNFILYAYTLMNNHIHLLIETEETPLSKIMQGLLQSHAQWHNRKYKTVGHLFQGRYKAILCDRDEYLLVLVRYIHLNPVRAGIVKDPADYRWSSHRVYLGLEYSRLIDTEFVLSQFSRGKKRAIELYREFIDEGIDEGRRWKYYRVRDQRVLGNDDFYEGVMMKTKQVTTKSDGVVKDKTLEEILEKVGEVTGVTEKGLRGKTRDKGAIKARGLFIRLSTLYTVFQKREIAKYLNREPGSLSYIERNITEDEFNKFIEKLKW